MDPKAPKKNAAQANHSSRRQVVPQPVTISFTLDRRFLNATFSAIVEVGNRLGQKLEGQAPFPTEDAWTEAVIGLGAMRAALHTAGATEHKDYVA